MNGTTTQNLELASRLEALAVKLRAATEDLSVFTMAAHVYEKEPLVRVLRALGGRWNKRQWGTQDNQYLTLSSVDFAPLEITIPRDKVCKKTVTWDCEPLLSPAEEAEVFEAAGVGE